MRVQLGERVRFLPPCFNRDDTENMVTGRIVYVNRRHRYYIAEYPAGRQTLREAFKYAEEGGSHGGPREKILLAETKA